MFFSFQPLPRHIMVQPHLRNVDRGWYDEEVVEKKRT